MPTGEGYNKQG